MKVTRSGFGPWGWKRSLPPECLLLCVLLFVSGEVPAQSELDGPAQTAEAYLSQAESQIANGETSEAEASLLNALNTMERYVDASPERIIELYASLGDVYLAIRDYELAAIAFFNARDVSRRSYGLFNIGQIEIVRKMAEASLGMGDLGEAMSLHQQAVSLLTREFGFGSDEANEANIEFADWLSQHGHNERAASLYRGAGRAVPAENIDERVQLYRKAAQNNFLVAAATHRPDLDQREPRDLISAADSVAPGLVSRTPIMRLGRGRVQRIEGCLRIDFDRVAQEPIEDPLLAAQLLRDIGDWCVALGEPRLFGNPYIAAWELLGLVENGDLIRKEWFAATTPVYMPVLSHKALSTEADAVDGSIELEFVINENGAARRIEVVAAEPEGLLDRKAKRRVDNARFRPRVENGEIVKSTGELSFDFRYEPEELEQAQ